MTPEEFNALVERRKGLISSVLQRKASEYSTEGDRLHNFKRSAAFARKSPALICLHFALKHLTSIADLVDSLDNGDIPTGEVVDEKLGDAINYLILLEALVQEAITRQGVRV